jgi:hypothetical protein
MGPTPRDEQADNRDILRALGSMVSRPPLRPYHVPQPPDDAREADLDSAVEWTREDR